MRVPTCLEMEAQSLPPYMATASTNNVCSCSVHLPRSSCSGSTDGFFRRGPGGGGEGRGVVKAPPLLEEEDPTSLGGYLEVSETAEESLGSGAVGGVVV